MQIISTYFDFNDFTNPVKSYWQNLNNIGLIKDTTVSRAYNVKVNEVYDNSNIIFGSQTFSSNYNFYSIEKGDADFYQFSGNKNIYLYITFALDSKVNQYYRTSYSFWDMFGYIGGIYGLLKALGYFTFNFLTKRQFYTSVLSELYHVDVVSEENKFEENNNALIRNLVKEHTKNKKICKGIFN